MWENIGQLILGIDILGYGMLLAMIGMCIGISRAITKQPRQFAMIFSLLAWLLGGLLIYYNDNMMLLILAGIISMFVWIPTLYKRITKNLNEENE